MARYRSSARRRSNRRRKRQTEYRQTGVLTKLLIMLAVVAAIVLGVAIFFRVHTVDVQGNTIYSKEQVIKASGLEEGDNLLMVNRAAVVSRIKTMMPYVRDVSISPMLPDTVVIQVRESDIAVLVRSDIGAAWYMNTDGRIMGSSVEGFRGQVIELSGVTLTAPKVGEQAAASEGQSENLSAALQVVRQMEGTGLMEQITALDAKKSFDLILFCDDRLEILMGGTEELEYKIEYLQVILEDLEDYQVGTIDLTFDVERVARFIERPVDTAEKEEEEETEPSETEDTE